MSGKTDALPALNLQPPQDESATFQHSPSPTAELRREWEPGCQPDAVYEKVLPPWRAWMRRKLVQRLREEKDWMAEWQARVQTVVRDKYFYWTAVFGTHTFFTAFLPLLFFYGQPERGRGMVFIVGMGVYVSSFAKDLVCTPRPYSPPVVRLTMSTHHHEYGFPSSHSTNSVSIALFLGEWLWTARDRLGLLPIIAGWAALAVYAFSIVGGRLYTGMHSKADVIGGSLMGLGCWLLWVSVEKASERWVNTGSSTVPSVMIPMTLALVHWHPEPVDDCPCFEDAIVTLSVILGSYVGHWLQITQPWMFKVGLHGATKQIFARGLPIGLAICILRFVIGVGIIFVFRIIAKTTLLKILPPIFRLTARTFDVDLPTRRHYKAATDYSKTSDIPFRPIPSVLDLQADTTGTSTPDASGENTPVSSLTPRGSFKRESGRSLSPMSPMEQGSGLRQRSKENLKVEGEVQSSAALNGHHEIWVPKRKRRSRAERARYDAEVLTKVGVYTGIALLATTFIPILLFGRLEAYLGL